MLPRQSWTLGRQLIEFCLTATTVPSEETKPNTPSPWPSEPSLVSWEVQSTPMPKPTSQIKPLASRYFWLRKLSSKAVAIGVLPLGQYKLKSRPLYIEAQFFLRVSGLVLLLTTHWVALVPAQNTTGFPSSSLVVFKAKCAFENSLTFANYHIVGIFPIPTHHP